MEGEHPKKAVMRLFWYVALPIGVLSFYFGGVALYYYSLVKLDATNLFVGMLAMIGGLSIITYNWTRTGSLLRIVKLHQAQSSVKLTRSSTRDSLRDFQKWCFGLIGAVVALIALLRYRGIRIFASFAGMEIDDMTLVYIDIFWLLTMLILSEILLSHTKRAREVDLPRVSRHLYYLYTALWYFLAGLTGSYAYALGVPPVVDAAIVVAFVLLTTVYRLVFLRHH